jgi:hypothetical protein
VSQTLLEFWLPVLKMPVYLVQHLRYMHLSRLVSGSADTCLTVTFC